MPKSQRSPEEVQNIREEIMREALELITTDGFNNFSMRKLATRLGVAAKTIYNYFQNQDELYLCIHTKGFEQLLEYYKKATRPYKDPMDKLDAIAKAYIEFGLKNQALYNLMHLSRVPRHDEYVGTPMENVARLKLEAFIKQINFIVDLAKEYLGNSPDINEYALQVEVIHAWSHLHGYVAGVTNSVIDYLIDDPLSLKELVIDRVNKNVRTELSAIRDEMTKRKELKLLT